MANYARKEWNDRERGHKEKCVNIITGSFLVSWSLMQSAWVRGWGISATQDLSTHRTTSIEWTYTDIRFWSGIRNHYFSVCMGCEDSSYLRPGGNSVLLDYNQLLAEFFMEPHFICNLVSIYVPFNELFSLCDTKWELHMLVHRVDIFVWWTRWKDAS
jgi:hypothetical protein